MEPLGLGCWTSPPFIYLPFHPFLPSAVLVGVLVAFLTVVTKYRAEVNLRKEGRKGLFWLLVQEDIVLMGKA